MDREKLSLIVRNLESLVDCLKKEIEVDGNYTTPQYEEVTSYLTDYDEVFYDDAD